MERKGILDFIELARRMPEAHFFWFGCQPESGTEVRAKRDCGSPGQRIFSRLCKPRGTGSSRVSPAADFPKGLTTS